MNIDILTRIYRSRDNFLFHLWLCGFFNLLLVRPALPTVLLIQTRIPLAQPVVFELLCLEFFLLFIVLQRLSPNLQMFVCVFAKKFPAVASQSRCEVSRPRAVSSRGIRISSITHSFCLSIYLDFYNFIDLFQKIHLIIKN